MRLTRQLRWSLILLGLTSSALPAQIVGANADSIPKASWVGIYFHHFDEAARAARLAPLREMPLRAGEREIRLWTDVALGEPKHLYRLTQSNGRVRGERIEYWTTSHDGMPHERPGETWHDGMLYRLRGYCGDLTTSSKAAACRVRFVKEPRWERVLREAEAHGLWTLPDPSVLPPDNKISIDGWTMVVELRDGPRYRTYHYHNPGSRPYWPSDAQAREIVRTFRPIDSLARLPDVVKVYRGLTTGRYRSAFRSCAGEAPWELHDELRSLLQRSRAEVRDSAPRQASDSTVTDSTLYEVELLGQLYPEWSARDFESKFSRVLHPMELRWVRLATASCAKAR